MAIFAGASAGAVVRLRCPQCGEVQARARGPKDTVYTCRNCRRSFTRDEARERKGRRK